MPDDDIQLGFTSPVEENGKESIKIYKNTKGYNFDIKIISPKLCEEDKKRLIELNNWAIQEFGSKI